MNPGHAVLPHDIALLEEPRAARAVAELADEAIEVAGGVACCAGPGSSLNLVLGLGMHGPVTDEELDRMVAFYDERGVEPKVELCPFADPSAVRGLGARGFVVDEFETVLARDLREIGDPAPLAGLTLRPVDPADPTDLDAFVATHIACFMPEGDARAEAVREDARRIASHPRSTTWLARIDGEIAASAGLEILGSAATLIVAGVLPRFRRRGIQSALIAHRCAVARDAGCSIATIGSAPHSPTGRNALRAGFVTAYTKPVLARAAR